MAYYRALDHGSARRLQTINPNMFYAAAMYIDVPANLAREHRRLSKLADLEIMDTPPEADFDAIVDLAHRLLGCPVALITLIDDRRQWFKARCGTDREGTPRELALCVHTIERDDVTVAEDTRLDPRFASNPLVTGAPHIRFYAGAPLRPLTPDPAEDCQSIGSLCVIDTVPRTFSADDRAVLRMLAGLVDSLIQSRALAQAAVRSARRAERAAALLDRKNRQLGQAERMAAIGSWRLDLIDGELEWSDEVFAIHGLPPGRQPQLAEALSFYPEADRQHLDILLQRAVALGESWECESDFVTAGGDLRRVRSVGEVELRDGKPEAILGVFQDITQRHHHEISLREVANTDSLTGLPNRRMFEQRLVALTDEGAPFALLLIDLDGFKPVNDSLGHAAGDRVLHQMAQRLQAPAFAHAFVARLGGDEFVMAVTRPRDCATLPAFVQSLLRELRCFAEEGGTRLVVTASIGAALFDGTRADGREVLRNADLALYAAKRAQRGTGRIFGHAQLLLPWAVRAETSASAVA